MKRGRIFIFDEKADRERDRKELEARTKELVKQQERAKAVKPK
jgi:hypothetical protein